MDNIINLSKLKYSKHSINYAEYICKNISVYHDLYNDRLQELAYSFTSKDNNVKIQSYRKSDPTSEVALKISSGKDKEYRRIEEIVNSFSKLEQIVEKDSALKDFFKDYIVGDKIRPTDKISKRTRNKILSLFCFILGEPQKYERTNKHSKSRRQNTK